jgi:hypothetical protein
MLPVYRTTPTAALHRESGLPPPEISLNTQALASTVRLRQLDQGHPLHRRAKRVLNLARPTSRFARRVLALPQSKSTDLLAYPPWTYLESREAASHRIGAPLGASKEQCARDLLTFLPCISPGDIVLFSDGSKLSNGATGAGFVVYQASHEVLRQSIPLGLKAEVFDAEAIAALAGAETAIALPSA